MLDDFIKQWNEKHPEMPAERWGNNAVLMRQDRFPYGNIDVALRNGRLDCYVSAFDGEEMEPEWLGEAETVEKAVDYAEYGIHPGNTCSVCGKEHKYRFDGFVKLGKKLYCGDHIPRKEQ
jgi:hypothetical protein